MEDKITKFEDLIIWQRAEKITIRIYQEFGKMKDYAFRDQIIRCVISIMNNIAEGYERWGNKEYSRFLYIAKGSCGELRSMLHLSFQLGYITEPVYNKLTKESIEISKMIFSLIRKL